MSYLAPVPEYRFIAPRFSGFQEPVPARLRQPLAGTGSFSPHSPPLFQDPVPRAIARTPFTGPIFRNRFPPCLPSLAGPFSGTGSSWSAHFQVLFQVPVPRLWATFRCSCRYRCHALWPFAGVLAGTGSTPQPHLQVPFAGTAR